MDEIVITLASQTVRPGESLFASAFFFNLSVPTDPMSVDYRVDDVQTGDEIRDWTPCVPGFSSTSVILENEDVALLVASDLKEYRRVTFRATLGPDTVTESAIYAIQNLGYQSIVISLGCDLRNVLERYSPLPSSRISRNVELDNWNP
jgi:hypothetical protein